MTAHVPLQGRHVRLEPLQEGHHAALCEAGRDADIFRWFPITVAGDRPMRAFIDTALADAAAGRARPFVVRRLSDQRIVGSTRYGAIEPAHRRGEIGWTWLEASAQRTAINTECKRLLLTLGFETLGFNRVEFKTDALNTASRAAIARLGAVQEGFFRQHMVTASGRVRDTVYFSIVQEEWPAVRARLDAMLGSSAVPSP